MSKDIFKKSWFVLFLILFFALIYLVTLQEPYHADSSIFMQTIKHFENTGEIKYFFNTRLIPSFILYVFHFIFGRYTLSLTTILTGFTAILFYFLWLKQHFSKIVAMLSTILLLTIPASIMTLTHVKEDFIGFMFLMMSLYLLSKNKTVLKYISAVFFALALLSKEAFLGFIPFFFGYIFSIETRALDNSKKLHNRPLAFKHSLIITFLALLIVIVVNKSYLLNIGVKTGYLYDWRLVGSPLFIMPIGLKQWIMGLGIVLFCTQFISLGLLFSRKNIIKRLHVLMFYQFVLLAVIFINSSYIRYRHFFIVSCFSLPLMLEFVSILMRRVMPIKKSNIIITCLMLPVLVTNISKTLPVVYFRSSYNPVAQFYKNIELDKDTSIMLGMDNLSHIKYFTNLTSINHPINPTHKQALEYKEKIDNFLNENKKLYIIPGFFEYDKYGFIKSIIAENYELIPVYTAWHEDYHDISMGIRIRISIENYKKQYKGRNVVFEKVAKDKVSGIEHYKVRIFDKKGKQIYALYEYGIEGRIFPELRKESLLKLEWHNY